MRALLNQGVRRDAVFRGLFTDAEYRDVRTCLTHQGLAPTPLRSLPSLASTIGIHHVDAKDETTRFGLNAFKILGVHYAVHKLGDAAVRRGLVCATAGNHGRAVARVARQKQVPCTVFVPAPAGPLQPAERRTRTGRVDAMRADGATVVDVAGTYEDAVRAAADHGSKTGATIVSDTSWDGYEEVPRWIMAGYTQLFEEAQAQWECPPDLALVQAGVGGLLCAAASWFTSKYGAHRPFLIACEPDGAACLLESARAGRSCTLTGELHTIMAGLRCAEPSRVAWPTIAEGVDAFVTVSDQHALDAMERLKSERIDAGPSGACGAAALVALASAPELVHIRHASRLDRSTRALIVVTESA